MKQSMLMIAAAMLGLATLTGCGPSQAEIEKGAKAAVEDLFKKAGASDAVCKELKITKKLDSKHYEGTATLVSKEDENLSRTIKILIEVSGDNVIVSETK